MKNGVKHTKANQEKLLQKCILNPIAKDPNPNNGIKMQQKLLFFRIFTNILLT